jgi:hypothetical protein
MNQENGIQWKYGVEAAIMALSEEFYKVAFKQMFLEPGASETLADYSARHPENKNLAAYVDNGMKPVNFG